MTAARKKTESKSRLLYLLYGNRAAEVNEAKVSLLRELIPNDEERRENVAEILPPANQPLTLKAAFPQLVAELGQESLFGDSRRVVIVHQLQELFGTWGRRGRSASTRKKKSEPSKADPLETFVQTIRDLLDATPNALILLAVEDDAKNRRVNDKSPLFQALSDLGTVRQFSAKSYRFELSDAIVARSLPMAMEVVTAWRRDDSRAAIPIFRTLLDDIRLLIQAFIHQRESRRITREADYAALLFPPDLQPNLQTIHEFRRRKYLSGIHAYALPPLLEALEGLLEIQKALYPTGDELYVPDVDYLTDVWLAKLLSR